MTMHMVAFKQASLLAAPYLQALTPVPDPTVTENGTLLYVPDKYNQVIVAVAIALAGTGSRNYLESPSLREMFYPELVPFQVSGPSDNVGMVCDFRGNPIALVTNEGLQFFSDLNNAAVATTVYGVVVLADGKTAPSAGKIFPIQATAAITQVAGAWVNGPITFSQTLPVGSYDIVGMRVSAAGLIAARLVFIGASAVTRPGVLGSTGFNYPGLGIFRMGQSGLFGTFDSTTPPSLEVLGGGVTAQEIVLDLIKR